MIELTVTKVYTPAIPMPAYSIQPWEENDRQHALERRLTAELLASGQKTPAEMQEENSLFPMDAVIEMKWTEYAERLERAHA